MSNRDGSAAGAKATQKTRAGGRRTGDGDAAKAARLLNLGNLANGNVGAAHDGVDNKALLVFLRACEKREAHEEGGWRGAVGRRGAGARSRARGAHLDLADHLRLVLGRAVVVQDANAAHELQCGARASCQT